jgi:hypothetical protein
MHEQAIFVAPSQKTRNLTTYIYGASLVFTWILVLAWYTYTESWHKFFYLTWYATWCSLITVHDIFHFANSNTIFCVPLRVHVSRLFWVSSLAYSNLFGTKGYVVVVVVVVVVETPFSV